MKTSSKLFHSYIRHKKTDCPGIGPIWVQDETNLSDPALMAQCFADTFCSIYTDYTPLPPAAHQTADACLTNIDITLEDVKIVLTELDADSSMGPDGIHPCLLKFCL